MTDVADAGSRLATAVAPVRFGEAFGVWLRIGLLSFGGPAGQIALMHRILVEEKRWISEARFLHALNYCMLLPGPEAQQLAVYVGWLLHRTAGGLVAGVLFVLPGAAVILLLSVLYAGFRDLTVVQALFFGIKAAVLAVVVEAVIRIGRRALKNRALYAIAAVAFIAIFFLEAPFPLIVVSAAVAGFVGGRLRPDLFILQSGHGGAADDDDLLNAAAFAHTRPSLPRALAVTAICLVLWIGPLAALWTTLGAAHVFTQEGVFFSKMAVVTFGGAYAVLAYVAQQAVETYQWLAPGEMLDGLGMAETTPGPLILVLQFVGFMGAFRHPGALDPMTAGVIGAALTTWVTFVPCFLWIFLGAPYIEALRGKRLLTAALSAITAAVVGVILNLAVWFGVHVVFAAVVEFHIAGLRLLVPDWGSVNLASLLLTMAALIAMLRFKVGMVPTLAGTAALGFLYVYGQAALTGLAPT
ncbi:MAG TPA: chromate efflux transporter [Kiloniellaceae bacterium]